jgi:cysteine desulfurase/selenocysteine lyase
MSTIDSTRRQLREAMPVAKKWAYFDHAAVAPISAPAAEVLGDWLREAAEEGDTVWLDWARQLRATRTAAAKLVGGSEDEIALVPNTTAGINLVAEGFPWQAGDNVVSLDDEFPANVYPWLHLESRGVETRRASTTDGRFDLDQLASLCDDRTRVVSVSWVGYANGCRRDLRAIGDIAHEHGAIFLVDAIQGLGVFPLNVAEMNIDCLAADGHKWLLGPEGAGIAYVSAACLERLLPIGVGWNSVVHAANFDHIELELKSSAARYEGGTYNMAGFLALGASLKLLLSLGVENVAAAILDFTSQAAAALEELGAVIHSPWQPDERSGIVSFELQGRNPVAFRKHCLKKNVALNCRAGRLRISAHAYNDKQDLDRLIDALKSAH